MADKASISSRYLAIPVLALTTSVSIVLFVLTTIEYKSGSGFAISVAENATLVGQAVHIVSRILGTLVVYALCCAINLSARSWLRQNPITLDRLKLLVGLCIARVDWSLPTLSLLFLLLFVLASSVPGILWTGALTPVPTTKLTNYRLPLPSYSNWTGITADVEDNTTYTVNTEQGTFSWLPWFNLQGSIIQAARDASNSSTANWGLRSHSKLDRSGFVYTGRSYGMGASVGLGDPTDKYSPSTGYAFSVPVTGYKFLEEGLLPTASCAYNSSSLFFLEQFSVPDSWSIAVFNAVGYFPNNATTIHAAVGLSPNQVVAMAAAAGDNATSTHYMALATGNGTFEQYGRLDTIQCDVTFQPKQFAVEVNTTLKTISVTPGADIAMPPHAHNLTSQLMVGIDIMGGVFDTSIWVSIVGDLFIHNIANIEARTGVEANSHQATFTGVKDSLESILDNVLLAFASAQIMVYNDKEDAPVQAYVQATAIGTPRDVYLVFAVNIVVCVVYAAVLVHISRGPGAGKFNLTDIKSIIVGTSAGGYGILKQAEKLHRDKGSEWLADDGDELIGEMSVRFCDATYRDNGGSGNEKRRRGVTIVLAEPEEMESKKKVKRIGEERESQEEGESTVTVQPPSPSLSESIYSRPVSPPQTAISTTPTSLPSRSASVARRLTVRGSGHYPYTQHQRLSIEEDEQEQGREQGRQ